MLKLLGIAVLLPLALPASAGGPASAPGLAASWRLALDSALPAAPVAAPRPVSFDPASQARTYERRHYAWESDARAAAAEAQRNMERAGVAVLSSFIVREQTTPWTYGFRIVYIDRSPEQGGSFREVFTFAGERYSFSSEAEDELRRVRSGLAAAGYPVVLAQLLREGAAPFRYFCVVDYLGRRQAQLPPK